MNMILVCLQSGTFLQQAMEKDYQMELVGPLG